MGELSLKSDLFRRLWARHDVREKASGTKRFVSMDAPEQLVVGYHAAPGSQSAQALALLATMAAEQDVPAVATTA